VSKDEGDERKARKNRSGAMAKRKFNYEVCNMKVLGSSNTRLGIKATIAISGKGGTEIHRDEVKLWNRKSREKFINEYLRVSKADLNAKQKHELQEKIDTELRALESKIKAQAKGLDVMIQASER
jgi:hypothetical protein